MNQSFMNLNLQKIYINFILESTFYPENDKYSLKNFLRPMLQSKMSANSLITSCHIFWIISRHNKMRKTVSPGLHQQPYFIITRIAADIKYIIYSRRAFIRLTSRPTTHSSLESVTRFSLRLSLEVPIYWYFLKENCN